jgi:hypothetical protein
VGTGGGSSGIQGRYSIDLLVEERGEGRHRAADVYARGELGVGVGEVFGRKELGEQRVRRGRHHRAEGALHRASGAEAECAGHRGLRY